MTTSSPGWKTGAGARWHISVDTGGTFTDCVGVNPKGRIRRAKVLSNSSLRGRTVRWLGHDLVMCKVDWGVPDNFILGYRFRFCGDMGAESRVVAYKAKEGYIKFDGPFSGSRPENAVFEVLSPEEAPVLGARVLTGTLLEEPLPSLELRLGTTRATNALLEEKVANTAFFVTQGFRDLLFIGDQRRPDLFARQIKRPHPLYSRVVEVAERLDAQGRVVLPIELETLDEDIELLLAGGCRTAAIGLMHAYSNAGHEIMLKEHLLKRGFTHVACSAEMAASIKFVPRAETAVVDACLAPIMETYLNAVESILGDSALTVMTSAGGLVPRNRYRPKDSLLSGPAGGVVGAAEAGRRAGLSKIIPFDMGGTSTDVSRFDGEFTYRLEHSVGRARLVAPALHIETVAAGGGSVCGCRAGQLEVGPESAGAFPGPACYGADGPLTLTDVNLLLGRLCDTRFRVPLFPAASQKELEDLLIHVAKADPKSPPVKKEEVLDGFLRIANERMAATIRRISVREGYDPATYAMVAFGGAGGMHACAVAGMLGVSRVLFPADAGLLSASGLGSAVVETFCEESLLLPLDRVMPSIEDIFADMRTQALKQLADDGYSTDELAIRQETLELRFEGQESTLTIDYLEGTHPGPVFESRYHEVFGYFPEGKKIEAVSARVAASTRSETLVKETFVESDGPAEPAETRQGFFDGAWCDVGVFIRSQLNAGDTLDGPAIVADDFSTLVVEPGWRAVAGSNGSLLVIGFGEGDVRQSTEAAPEIVRRELFTNRFRGIVEEMGQQLRRTALSTNVKERMDYSCGLLDPTGSLIVNAPHIPVHLGGLGACVRSIVQTLLLEPGDVIITNHPGYGGSHLPDVTVITPVYADGDALIGYVSNRAHHAEFGGMLPGSMPPDATCLAEEGVLIPPTFLFRRGVSQLTQVAALLTQGEYPSRAPRDNIADIKAQVAANIRGAKALSELGKTYSVEAIHHYFKALRDQASAALRKRLEKFPPGEFSAVETLDDGARIAVRVCVENGSLTVDFTGTTIIHSGNLNATPAIVQSAVIYVLRLMLDEDIPLNEGLMEPVTIVLPRCFLNPKFEKDPRLCPAVVGGNVETSQRIVDTLIRALRLGACSQGTMNNVVFGNAGFSYYETVCGGAGAGPDYFGASAVHTHMTNTAITDPEVLEFRYPVRLRRFQVRDGSGGDGINPGGDGIIREIDFLDDLSLSVLTQHRKTGPYGMEGGKAGKPGHQEIIRANGTRVKLDSIDQQEVSAGDRLILKTPGGGAWGEIGDEEPDEDDEDDFRDLAPDFD